MPSRSTRTHLDDILDSKYVQHPDSGGHYRVMNVMNKKARKSPGMKQFQLVCLVLKQPGRIYGTKGKLKSFQSGIITKLDFFLAMNWDSFDDN